MKPILVHCHIYYPQLWPELKKCIQNIAGFPIDLWVTMVEENKKIISDIRQSFPDAHIQIVDNRGYDVGPFVHVLNQVDLNNYSYVVKLHTKRDIDYIFHGMTGSHWRESLLKPFQSQEVFNAHLAAFEKNPKIGMQADYKLIIFHDIHDKEAKNNLKSFLRQKNWPILRYGFVAGTMFIARADLLKPIQDLHLTLSDFSRDIQGQHHAQEAHMIERLFGYIIYRQGFKIKDVFVSEFYQKLYGFYYHFIKPIIRFLFQKKITKSRHLVIKVCKIPVYREKL